MKNFQRMMAQGSAATVALENEVFRVLFRPEDGGRIVELTHKQTNFPLIWINPRTSDVYRYYGCDYDDLSNSGVEEAFPTVQPCAFDGAKLPFFGEVWNIPWQVCQQSDRVSFRCLSPIYPAQLEKTFCFSADGQALITDYAITNIGAKAFPYIFGVHPSLTLREDTVLSAPEGRYELYVSQPENFPGTPVMTWPSYEGIDFSKTRPASSLGCYNLVAMPAAGDRYGVYHPSLGVGLEVVYDPDFFRCLSLWPIYGGFRGHTCLMSEVFTCWPAQLDIAVAQGLACQLDVGETRHTTVTYQLTKEIEHHERL